MKYLFIAIFWIVSISCNGSKENSDNAITQSDNQNPTLKRYDVKSGMVTYKITINGKVMGSTITGSGSEKLYFKNWGATELKEENSTKTTKMNFFGKEKIKTDKTHTINKLDNGKSYLVNFKNASIYLRRDPMMELMKNTNTDAGNAGKEMLKSVGGKKIGEENFLGYPCEIWDAMGSKQWIYKGVTLKIVSKVMGITTIKEATEAKFNINVSDKHFQLPDFPIVKEEGYLSDDAYQAEQQDMKTKKDHLKKMSFEEFKKMAKQDPEMKNMTDKELKEQYKLMKQMLNLSNH